MQNTDYFLYLLHDIFWISFFVVRFYKRRNEGRQSDQSGYEPVVSQEKSAPFSRLLVALHSTGFLALYGGMAIAFFVRHNVPKWFAGQSVVGAAIILAGTALTCYALVSFRSWRIRAKLEKGHQLTVVGPFRIIRHPIYMGLNLLALGSAIWIPTPLVWFSVVAMAIGGDLSARSEEKLLGEAFESTYRDYCLRTKRFLPGIY